MSAPLVRGPGRRLAVSFGAVLVACTMSNPEFDEVRDELGGTAGDGDGDPGDGDGDADGDPTTGDGDGDGEPSTGDGDGDAESSTGDGDGDGDGDEPNPCADGLDSCDGACVDLKFDSGNCGMCGFPCDGDRLCGEGSCLAKKYVFVTSEHLHGGFGGPTTGTSLCNQLASAAQLPGSYRPWLSSANIFPAQVVNAEPSAFVLRGGPVIAYSWPAFLSGQHLAPINHDQFGDAITPSPACGLEYAVWTGTTDAGTPTEPNCEAWLNPEAFGVVGDAQAAGEGWSASDCNAPCGLLLPLYCVQE